MVGHWVRHSLIDEMLAHMKANCFIRFDCIFHKPTVKYLAYKFMIYHPS